MTWLPGTRTVQVVIMPAAKNFLPYFHLHLFAFSFQSLILVMPFSDGLKSSLVLTIFSPGRCFYPVIKLLLNLVAFFFYLKKKAKQIELFMVLIIFSHSRMIFVPPFYPFSNFSIKKET